jgi:hypothetical protein
MLWDSLIYEREGFFFFLRNFPKKKKKKSDKKRFILKTPHLCPMFFYDEYYIVSKQMLLCFSPSILQNSMNTFWVYQVRTKRIVGEITHWEALN